MGQPFANVTFPLSGNDLGQVARFRLRGAEFEHQIGIITLNSTALIYPDFLSGSPVIVEYGTTDVNDLFVGYVMFAKPSVSPKPTAPAALPVGQSVDIYCWGATFPMREQRQRVFVGLTSDQIAQKIASPYQLNLFAKQDYRVWPTYAQASQSDWSELVQLAHDVGYTVYPHGTQIRFHDRLLEVQRRASVALSFDLLGAGTNGTLPQSRQILSFDPVIGNVGTVDNPRSRKVIGNVDRRSGAAISAQDRTGPARIIAPLGQDPIFTQYVLDHESDNLSDALTWLTDIGEDNRWYITATAEVQGDARLLPAHPAYFANLPSDFSGYWYIRSVDHDIKMYPGPAGASLNSTYTCKLGLGRDGFGENSVAPSSVPQRVMTDLQDLGSSTESVQTSQLTAQGYWRSAFQTTVS